MNRLITFIIITSLLCQGIAWADGPSSRSFGSRRLQTSSVEPIQPANRCANDNATIKVAATISGRYGTVGLGSLSPSSIFSATSREKTPSNKEILKWSIIVPTTVAILFLIKAYIPLFVSSNLWAAVISDTLIGAISSLIANYLSQRYEISIKKERDYFFKQKIVRAGVMGAVSGLVRGFGWFDLLMPMIQGAFWQFIATGSIFLFLFTISSLAFGSLVVEKRGVKNTWKFLKENWIGYTILVTPWHLTSLGVALFLLPQFKVPIMYTAGLIWRIIMFRFLHVGVMKRVNDYVVGIFSGTTSIKPRLEELMQERIGNPRDMQARSQFERDAERYIHRFHTRIPLSAIDSINAAINALAEKKTGNEVNGLHNTLLAHTCLGLLEVIPNTEIGPPLRHIALVKESIQKMMDGDTEYFKSRFIGASEESARHITSMKNSFDEIKKDGRLFMLFCLALILHDYGLLLMRSGIQTHGTDGKRLAKTLLRWLKLTRRERKLVLTMIEAHGTFPMMFARHVSPALYSRLIKRLKKLGLSQEIAYKIIPLFLFLDDCSCDTPRLMDGLVHMHCELSNRDKLERFQNVWRKARFMPLAGEQLLNEDIERLFAERVVGRAKTAYQQIKDDPDFQRFVDDASMDMSRGCMRLLIALSVTDYSALMRAWGTKELSSVAQTTKTDNPNIFKFFYILAMLYRNYRLNPEETTVFIEGNLMSMPKLNTLLDGLEINRIRDIFSNRSQSLQDISTKLSFRITLDGNRLTLNLRKIQQKANTPSLRDTPLEKGNSTAIPGGAETSV